MSLEKVLALAGQTTAPPRTEDMASELVASALAGLAELNVLLSDSDMDDDDDGKGKGGDDHSSHSTYKKLKQHGMSDSQAAAACAKADKKMKASALAEAVTIALSGLQAGSGDWVEATAVSTSTVALAKTKSAPYGDVQYADPGYRDGKKRYPIDTEEHVRAAWSYINQKDNAAEYSSAQLSAIKSKIRAAMRRHGIQASDDSKKEKVAASVAAETMALARAGASGVAFSHSRFTGRHDHPHTQTGVHSHEHEHFDDSEHYGGPMHRQGSTPSRVY